MRTVAAFIRTLIYALAFALGSILFSLAALAVSRLERGWIIAVVSRWARYHRWCARWILGQRVVVEGVMPDGPYLYIFKHESMFETIEQPMLFRHPSVFAKAELLDIPLWGAAARRYGLIPVDRDGGGVAMRAMMATARAALAEGRPICLFAEGTRVPHGETPPLKPGFAGLYKMMNAPVIPVAVDSGVIYPARGFIKYPGIIGYKVGETIPPGLPRDDAEARVHAAINALNAPTA